MHPLLKLSARRPDSFAQKSLGTLDSFVPFRGRHPALPRHGSRKFAQTPVQMQKSALPWTSPLRLLYYLDSHEAVRPQARTGWTEASGTWHRHLGIARRLGFGGLWPAIPHPGRARLAEEREDPVSVVAGSGGSVIAARRPAAQGIPASASLVRIQRMGKTWKSETVMSLAAAGSLTVDHAGLLLYRSADEGWNELRLENVVRWRPGTQLPVKKNPLPDGKMPSAGPVRVLRDRFGCVWIGR